MSEVATLTSQLSAHGRPSKFTPTSIRQITNLLERGKSKEEIAEIIGVTPATLQVKCSKLGISLRRTAFAVPVSRPPRPPRSPNGKAQPHLEHDDARAMEKCEARSQAAAAAISVEESGTIVRLKPPIPAAASTSSSNGVVVTMRYRGEERTVDLPADRNFLALLALEAEFRSMTIGQLIGQLLLSVAKNDLFDLVLDRSSGMSEWGESVGDKGPLSADLRDRASAGAKQ